MKRIILPLFTLLFSFSAFAYVPPFWLIMSRTAENHGRGIYMVEQDVVLSNDSQEPIVIHEKWIVKDGQRMRVTATGKKNLENKLSLTFIYNKNTKTYLNSQGAKKVVRTGEDWFEPYFFFRYSKKIKPKMHKQKMIPAAGLKDPIRPGSLNEVKYQPEEFVRLARHNGSIAYAIGEASTAGSLKPGLWVEQDAFYITKIRLPSLVEVNASDYNRHSYGFWFANNREVVWGKNRAKLTVTSVKRLSSSRYEKQLSTISLNPKKEPTLKENLPDISLVQEFYSRFR